MACLEDPFRFFKAAMAAVIISMYFGCSAGFLGAAFFWAFGAAADMIAIYFKKFENEKFQQFKHF